MTPDQGQLSRCPCDLYLVFLLTIFSAISKGIPPVNPQQECSALATPGHLDQMEISPIEEDSDKGFSHHPTQNQTLESKVIINYFLFWIFRKLYNNLDV